MAVAADGDTIDFSVSTPATITLTNGQLLVDKSVTIAGPGSGNLAVDGNAASRVFYVASFKSVSISGLTITNGRSSGVSFDGHGGGIFNDHATLTVSNCTVSGNLAAYGGAGICNNGYLGPNAALQIVNSTFTSIRSPKAVASLALSATLVMVTEAARRCRSPTARSAAIQAAASPTSVTTITWVARRYRSSTVRSAATWPLVPARAVASATRVLSAASPWGEEGIRTGGAVLSRLNSPNKIRSSAALFSPMT